MAYQRHSSGDNSEILNDSNGVALNGLAKTATFDTAWYNLGACDFFGILVKATVTGTSPTLDIDVEMTPDSSASSVVVHNYPAAVNSQTQAAIAQITATSTPSPEFWPNFIPLRGSGATPAVRFECTIGGTNPSFTLTMNLIRIYRSA
jgi:hypothetical protein